ncbi:MAG: 16S rRNA (adenine(1518)-N(6)/adenine(1519)-N(6))-dimethyltransferase RsmA [Bacteroidales bacterium]
MGLVRPKKSLGQHFLSDANIARKIAGSLQPQGDCPILEIGPGMGMLTRYLLEMYQDRVWVVEIDPESVQYLEEHFEGLGKRIIREDFLKTEIGKYFNREFCWIGNLPYNISSPIFFRLLEHHTQVPQMVAMVQKEVAERIAAGHGSKTYGILSILLQAYFKVEYLFTVSENVFIPPPKVKSAVLRLTRLDNPPACEQTILISLVKTAFNQRRKMLRNALSGYANLLEAFPEVAEKRAEQLPVAEYLRMAQYLTERGSTVIEG